MKPRSNSQVAQAAARSPLCPKSHHCGLKSHHVRHLRMVLSKCEKCIVQDLECSLRCKACWNADKELHNMESCATGADLSLWAAGDTALHWFSNSAWGCGGKWPLTMQNCTSECMEQGAQHPDLCWVLLYSADPISAAVICESNPQEKINFSGKPQCKQQGLRLARGSQGGTWDPGGRHSGVQS